MPTRTYDPKAVLVNFLGNPMIGYAEGSFVKIERNDDAYALLVGADGEAARSRSRNKSGIITITLMQSSPSNLILSAAVLADELSGTGIGALFIKDNSGTTLAVAANAWVKKHASVNFSKELGDKEWVLECDSLEIVNGGN